MGRAHRSIPPSDRHRTGGSLFNPIVRHPAARLTVAGVLLVLLVTLVGNASAVSTTDSRAASLRWDNRTFTSGPALVSHLSAKGIDADAFLQAHPSAAGELGLTAVSWDGKAFFTMTGLRSWSRRTGTSLTRWLQRHPRAATILRRNAEHRDDRCSQRGAARPRGAPRPGRRRRRRRAARRPSVRRSPSRAARGPAPSRCPTPIAGSGARRRPAAPTSAVRRHRRTWCRAPTQAPRSGPLVRVGNSRGREDGDVEPAGPGARTGARRRGRRRVTYPAHAPAPTATAVAHPHPGAAPAPTPTVTPPPPRTGSASRRAAIIEWANDADLARELDGYGQIGAGWIRFDIKWSIVEATRGTYDWTIYDRLVGEARKRGLSVVANLAYTPSWARPAGATDDKYAPVDVAGLRELRKGGGGPLRTAGRQRSTRSGTSRTSRPSGSPHRTRSSTRRC